LVALKDEVQEGNAPEVEEKNGTKGGEDLGGGI
jgi:hypothetical protein